MAEITENPACHGAVKLEESVMAPAEERTSPKEEPETALEANLPEIELLELENFEKTIIKQEQEDKQTDGQMARPPTDDVSTSESKWVVGAPCRAVWSEDGQVYPAKVVAADGERCRVCFDGYGNEEVMELSALQSPGASPQTQTSQDWKPGSRCRAVYSEDGLVYPAVVLWVKGQRCCVRYDNYNNEEEHDVSSLLHPDELHGPSRVKGSSWKSSATSSNFDWKKRREDNQEERGGGRRWRDGHQNSSTVKEKAGSQRQSEREADEKKRGNQPGEEAEKPANHNFPHFPPYPPPPMGSVGPMSFLSPPPPPPPVWILCGKEAGGSPDVNTITNMLMQWYMCGFHTGTYMAQQLFKSTLKDEVKSQR